MFDMRRYHAESEEKQKFWTSYAQKILTNPKATYSECKAAAIGVSSFDKNLEKKLLEKKGKPPRY
tara:strand:+ start:318 stop:512 length:195 start_codon:yes stop_codon:yes gene_type:complete